MATHTSLSQGRDASMRSSLEQRVGIIHYASRKEHSWSGQTRTRFTDFQVHEIDKDGNVVHLKDFQTNIKQLAKPESSHQPAVTTQVAQASRSGDSKHAADNASAPTTDTKEPQTQGDSEQPKDEKDAVPTISPADRTILVDLTGADTMEELVGLYSKANNDDKPQHKASFSVKIAAISDKGQRSRVHSEIRRIFGGKLDTITDADGSIKATIVGRGSRQWRNHSRNERPRKTGQNTGETQDGDFLHFTLYKENRDTMDAIGQIARFLNLKPAFFGIAGTKDRRAVTTQRVSVRRRNPQSLVSLNNGKIYGVKIGDFKFEQHSLHLGHHNGNEFVIVMKNCHFSQTEGLTFEQKLALAKTTVESALEQVTQNGFINYYGTQRFGTHHIGTQEIGVKILQQDFESAVLALLSFDPELLKTADPNSLGWMRRDDSFRAKACSIFLETGNLQEATKLLPKRCHVESNLMRHLSRQPKDFLGAILSISRTMRTMYVHAYQSLVWNFAASKRWELFGRQVVKGDLVLIESETMTLQENGQNANDEEETIHLGDAGSIPEDTRKVKVHALTEEEAKSGKYSIFDIVLPSPGWDVVYPDNEIAQFYEEFMAREENGGLDPHNMLRRQKDFSLPGSYRKLMGEFIGTPSASVQAYSNDTEQLVPTDLDVIQSRKSKEAAERVAAPPELRAPWKNFIDNVQERDLQEYRAAAERRKAEESSNEPETQITDTWVQTSVNGSNKRVKVSTHTDNIKQEITKPAQQPHGTKVSADEPMADQPNAVEEAQSTVEGDGDAGSTIVTALTTQVRAVTTSALQFLMTVWDVVADSDIIKIEEGSTLPEVQPEQMSTTDNEAECTTHQDDVNATVNNSGTNVHTDLEPHPSVGDGEAVANKPEQLASTSANGHAKTLLPHERLFPMKDEKKIAVVFRFALNTSQYATMVIREFQGMAATSDDTAP
ncbi:pseudouridine synthase [Hypomontagnella monticulosa]|nr:pseudouridine synthase [Hypomontagnella monticulosa]